MFPRAAAVTVAVALALLGGCAKDDEQPLVAPTGTTPPLSQADFLEQANKVCKDADTRIIALTDNGFPVNNNDGGQDQTERKKVVDEMVPVAENAIAHLKSLTPPAEDKALVDRGIARIQSNLDAAKQNASNQIDPIGSVDQELYAFGLYACFSKG